MTKAVRRLANSADVGDIDAWFTRTADRLIELVAAAWAVARQLAARFLGAHAAAEGHAVVPTLAVWNSEQVHESLRITGPVAFKKHIAVFGDPDAARATMATTLSGSAQRLSLAGDRETTHATAEASDEIVGWRRVSDGDPCPWCAMLISRGSVYKSKRSATSVVGRSRSPRGTGPEARDIGQSYHDGDGCTAVPLYAHEDEPQSVLDLQDEWDQVTRGLSGAEALRAWRRHREGREQPAASMPIPSRTRTPGRDDSVFSRHQKEAAALVDDALAALNAAANRGDLAKAHGAVDAVVRRALADSPPAHIEDMAIRMRTTAAEADTVEQLLADLRAIRPKT